MTKTTSVGHALRSLALTVLCAVLSESLASPALAQPNECDIVGRSAAGPNAAAIQAEVDAFRAELGDDNGADGSYASGRRELTWDGFNPDAPSTFVPRNVGRGLILSSGALSERLQVSAGTGGGSTPPRFGNISPLYPTVFQAFSGGQLFTPLGTNRLSVEFVTAVRGLQFVTPGWVKPATVRAFGTVFVDVDQGQPPGTYMVFYGIDGTNLGTVVVPPFSRGLSFAAGMSPCQPIGRVKIQLGTAVIDATTPQQGDVVVMDNVIYSEPRPVQSETLDFDGDNKTDFAIYRPSNGGWYIRSSRDETMEAAVWGLPGDIPVPADYNGDGRTDFAVFRPNTGEWLFLARASETAPPTQIWGQPGDIPVPFDYDHDGKVDIAVWRSSDGGFYIKPSSLPSGDSVVIYWGEPGDVPLLWKQ